MLLCALAIRSREWACGGTNDRRVPTAPTPTVDRRCSPPAVPSRFIVRPTATHLHQRHIFSATALYSDSELALPLAALLTLSPLQSDPLRTAQRSPAQRSMQELFADQEEALAAQRQSTHAHMQQHYHHHHHSHHHHHDSHMDRPLPADQAPIVLLHPLPTAQLLHLLPTAPQPAVAHTAPVMPVNGWHTISVADPPLTCAHDPQHIMLELAKAPPPPVPPAAAAVSPATLAELQARAHAAAAASSSTSESASAMTLGMRLLIWSSGILAVMICTSGCVLLSQEERALLLTEDKCNQLYVWCMLFVMFEVRIEDAGQWSETVCRLLRCAALHCTAPHGSRLPLLTAPFCLFFLSSYSCHIEGHLPHLPRA